MPRLEDLERNEEEALKLLEDEPEPEKIAIEEPPQKEDVSVDAGKDGVGDAAINEDGAPKKELPKTENTPSEDSTWEQKYKTLKGKYDSEVPRLTGLAKESTEWKEVAVALNKKIALLEADLSKLNSEKATSEVDVEIEKLGKDYPEISAAIKKLQDGHKQELADLRKELTSGITNGIEGVRTEVKDSVQTNFDIAMRTHGVDDWKEIDNSSEWKEWLSKPVPFTSRDRMFFLKEAVTERNAEKVASFFKQFKESKAQALTSDANANETPAEDKRGNLEKYVAPPRNVSGGNHEKGSDKAAYTLADYVKFSDLSARGKYNPKQWGGKTEEELEAEFNRLIANGKLK